MARCRKCNAEIPDGQELCSQCEQKNNESYLDDLLKSVRMDDDSSEDTPATGRSRAEKRKEEPDEIVSKETDDVPEILQEEPLEDIETIPEKVELDESEVQDDDPFLLSEEEADRFGLEQPQDDEPDEFDQLLSDIKNDANQFDVERGNTAAPEDVDQAKQDELTENSSNGNESVDEKLFENEDDTKVTQEERDALAAMFAPQESEDVGSDILELLGEAQGDDLSENSSEPEKGDLFTSADDGGEDNAEILDLIDAISSGEPIGDISSANDNNGFGTEEDLEMGREPENIADIFGSTIQAIDDLSDIALDDSLGLESLDGPNDIISIDNLPDSGESENKSDKKKKDKKPSIWQRLFGNIKRERSLEEIEAMKQKIYDDAEAKEQAEINKKKAAEKAKEEKKKKAAEAKAAAAKKKAEDAKKKAEAAKLKKDAKERKKQEIQNLIDEIDEDEGRINRVGASVIFLIFAATAAFIVFGTQIYSYSQSITNAEEDFEYQHYDEAYEGIAGLEIKEEDQTFYLQVLTVMYTYKQLNSYNNFYEMQLYPQALDSLLKGLKNYNKYSPLGSIIEVDDDMNFVKGQIVQMLNDTFDLSESEAVAIIKIEDRDEYTAKVYEIVNSIDRFKLPVSGD